MGRRYHLGRRRRAGGCSTFRVPWTSRLGRRAYYLARRRLCSELLRRMSIWSSRCATNGSVGVIGSWLGPPYLLGTVQLYRPLYDKKGSVGTGARKKSRKESLYPGRYREIQNFIISRDGYDPGRRAAAALPLLRAPDKRAASSADGGDRGADGDALQEI